MSNHIVRPLVFFSSRWRVWLPPVIFAVLIFAGAMMLSGSKEALSLVYRIF
jgi:hypothetical protein